MKIAWIDALRNCNPSRVQTRGLRLVYEPPHEPVHWGGTGKYRDETELTYTHIAWRSYLPTQSFVTWASSFTRKIRGSSRIKPGRTVELQRHAWIAYLSHFVRSDPLSNRYRDCAWSCWIASLIQGNSSANF